MRNLMSQIVVEIVVTVIGTVVADFVIKGMGGRGLFGAGHYAGHVRGGR